MPPMAPKKHRRDSKAVHVVGCDFPCPFATVPAASCLACLSQPDPAGISASMLTLTRFMHGDDSQGIMVEIPVGPYT